MAQYLARYSGAVRWAEAQRPDSLRRWVARTTERFERHPHWVTRTDQARLAAGRHRLGLTPLIGLPDITR